MSPAREPLWRRWPRHSTDSPQPQIVDAEIQRARAVASRFFEMKLCTGNCMGASRSIGCHQCSFELCILRAYGALPGRPRQRPKIDNALRHIVASQFKLSSIRVLHAFDVSWKLYGASVSSTLLFSRTVPCTSALEASCRNHRSVKQQVSRQSWSTSASLCLLLHFLSLRLFSCAQPEPLRGGRWVPSAVAAHRLTNQMPFFCILVGATHPPLYMTCVSVEILSCAEASACALLLTAWSCAEGP